MGYQKIQNLYRDQTVMEFRQVYAMEKIHGTSANIKYKDGKLTFFSGGVKHETFVDMFRHAAHEYDPETGEHKDGVDLLTEKFAALGHDEVIVYGEAYGGKCQRMADTYGPHLRFVAFEVQVTGFRLGVPTLMFMQVPRAETIAHKLGLEFVHYVQGPKEGQTMLEFLDFERDKPSTQAERNGIKEPKMTEGIVVRPTLEVTLNNGARVVAKHKRAEFGETKTPRKVVDVAEMQVLSDAKAVAEEWVVSMRLTHVLDKLKATGHFKDETGQDREPDMVDTRVVIKAMIEDVKAESEGEIVWSKKVEKAIGKKSAVLFKSKVVAL